MKKLLLLISIALLTVNVWGQVFNTPSGTIGSTTNPTTGNVGIGTASPGVKLDVLGQDINFFSETTTNTFKIGRNENEHFKLYITDNYGCLDYNQDSDNNTNHIFYIRNLAQGTGLNDIRFQTSGTDRLTISTSGNIGIGTAGPTLGVLQIKQNVDNNIGGLTITNSDVTRSIRIFTDGTNAIINGNSEGTIPLIFNQEGGNVGIGTTNPDALLHLGKDGEQIRIGRTGNGKSAVIGSKGHAIDGALNYSAYFAYDAYFDDESNTWKGVRTTLGRKFKMEMGYHNNDIRFSYSASGTTISWDDLMTIKSNGNVGIGTTSPAYLLSVAGTIGCGEVKVENVDNWADFVFEPEYELMSLKELDNFIQENKHLPEIPTTQEVEENGISVGEMNAKLLQKIEELTLYTIQQQDLIENQKELIEKLKFQMEKQNKRIEKLENK